MNIKSILSSFLSNNYIGLYSEQLILSIIED